MNGNVERFYGWSFLIDSYGSFGLVRVWVHSLGVTSRIQHFRCSPRQLRDRAMAAPLGEVLKDFQMLEDLQSHPESFRFTAGASLVVTAVHEPPYVSLHEDAGDGRTPEEGSEGKDFRVSGLLIHVLDYLAESMNFTYSLVRPPFGETSDDSDSGTATGMLGQLVRQEADLALGPFWITKPRHPTIDFSLPVSQTRQAIVSACDREDNDPWKFIAVLTPSVWLWLASAMTCTWLGMALVRRVDTRRHFLSCGVDTMFQIVRVLLQQVRRAHEKLIMGAWLMTATLLAWIFAGNILSIFLVRPNRRPFLSLGDLAAHPTMGVILPPDPALVGFLEDEFGKDFHSRITQHEISEFPQLLDTVVRRGDRVIIVSLEVADQLLADATAKTGFCDFYRSKDSFFARDTVMAAPKGSPLLPAINASKVKFGQPAAITGIQCTDASKACSRNHSLWTPKLQTHRTRRSVQEDQREVHKRDSEWNYTICDDCQNGHEYIGEDDVKQMYGLVVIAEIHPDWEHAEADTRPRCQGCDQVRYCACC
ncbi:olfactory ionotropic receptor IR7 [Penaeus vannamei]|uniref:Olfactory ionotropic receptor IR7 n=1 Tax=Penaeus vannamei TaxID=6689 RepID=A0A423U0P2_PENVA|nr:olfactory ionotropic receptor IR7 [Penaeus vannamei]